MPGQRDVVSVELPAFEGRATDHSYEEGSTYRACTDCGWSIEEGMLLLVHDGQPLHSHCFTARVGRQTVDNQWLTIASQVMLHPSRFRAAEIKAVIHNLVRMVMALREKRFHVDELAQVVEYRLSSPNGGYITEVLVRNLDGTQRWIPYRAKPESYIG